VRRPAGYRSNSRRSRVRGQATPFRNVYRNEEAEGSGFRRFEAESASHQVDIVAGGAGTRGGGLYETAGGRPSVCEVDSFRCHATDPFAPTIGFLEQLQSVLRSGYDRPAPLTCN
jgi:hypothetical protein